MAQRPTTEVTVRQIHWLNPHLVRLVFEGPALAGFDPLEFTDRYVKLVFPPLEPRPLMRTYTIRWFDPVKNHLAIDFVVHGDKGIAGPWARDAAIGDTISFVGPGGGYRPDADAPWHLLVGDASALPAIASALEDLPAKARAITVVELENPGDEIDLVTQADLELYWIYRAVPGDSIVDAVRELNFPDGIPHVFLHGDAGFVRDLRRFVRGDLHVPPERLSASGYWKRGVPDEKWRAEKRDWLAAVKADEAALPNSEPTA